MRNSEPNMRRTMEENS